MKIKKLNAQVNFLVEKDIKEKAEKVLAAEGMTISDYLRYCLKKKSMEKIKESV